MTRQAADVMDMVMLFVWVIAATLNAVHHNWTALVACLSCIVLTARIIDMQRHPQP